jgi:hypothetical protein
MWHPPLSAPTKYSPFHVIDQWYIPGVGPTCMEKVGKPGNGEAWRPRRGLGTGFGMILTKLGSILLRSYLGPKDPPSCPANTKFVYRRSGGCHVRFDRRYLLPPICRPDKTDYLTELPQITAFSYNFEETGANAKPISKMTDFWNCHNNSRQNSRDHWSRRISSVVQSEFTTGRGQ